MAIKSSRANLLVKLISFSRLDRQNSCAREKKKIHEGLYPADRVVDRVGVEVWERGPKSISTRSVVHSLRRLPA